MADTLRMSPQREAVYVRQPYEQQSTAGMAIEPVPVEHVQYTTTTTTTAPSAGYESQAMEAAELAAFEKGRMQGEMEAIRRAEAEAPLKTMQPSAADLQHQQDMIARANAPDVLEINRLTWIQRLAGVAGELCLAAMIVLTIVWVEEYRGDWGWTNSRHNGDISMFNAGMLAFSLGIFFNAQAISNYRFFHLNTNPHFNRAWYITMQILAHVCYFVALAAIIMTPASGEHTFWRVDNWCLVLALVVYVTHAMYSIGRTILDRVWPVKYETWAEVNNYLDHSRGRAPIRQGRAQAAAGASSHSEVDASGIDRRTVYTPAPKSIHRGANLPATNANVGAEVPVAPANAPRWAENPRTHSEDYFLLPRAKWANVGFWAMGASFLMLIASQQQLQAAGVGNWAQGDEAGLQGPIDQDGSQSHIIGVLGLVTLAGLVFISYASMPPRTTLVKNGILTGGDRRPSISHNADTQMGHHGHNVV